MRYLNPCCIFRNYDWSPSNPGLEMDVYTPLNDTANNRPLLIFAHGGVYIEGKIIALQWLLFVKPLLKEVMLLLQ